jgi:hypothetical protein
MFYNYINVSQIMIDMVRLETNFNIIKHLCLLFICIILVYETNDMKLI